MELTENKFTFAAKLIAGIGTLVLFVIIILVVVTSIANAGLDNGDDRIYYSANGTETAYSINDGKFKILSSYYDVDCAIINITDTDGNLINSSNYTVNNCEVTYA